MSENPISISLAVAVFKCIAGTTRMKVMNSVLRIIEGLLTDRGTLDDMQASCKAQTITPKCKMR
jgi:hypothetical protein